MRIYFLSDRTAGLKLNGAYLGLIGKFEKFVDVKRGDKILAECLPEGDALPVNFFICDELFVSPPDFLEVYLTGGDAVVCVSKYERREKKLQVVAQTDFRGGRYTLFINGGKTYLNCEKDTCALYELPAEFENAKLTESAVGGYPVLLVGGAGALAVISEEGKRVFFNPAERWECGDKLKVHVNFYTCAGCRAECVFGYDGKTMTLEKSVTRESSPPDPAVMHFAFFESVLTCGDFEKYLCDELKGSAAQMRGFLGEFTDVTLPYRKFYEEHGDIRAAGLVYPAGKNLFTVKYFAVEVENGLITNVYEIV